MLVVVGGFCGLEHCDVLGGRQKAPVLMAGGCKRGYFFGGQFVKVPFLGASSPSLSRYRYTPISRGCGWVSVGSCFVELEWSSGFLLK